MAKRDRILPFSLQKLFPASKQKTYLRIFTLVVFILFVIPWLGYRWNSFSGAFRKTWVSRRSKDAQKQGRKNSDYVSSSASPGDEKFLWYSPNGGFGNQIMNFRNALLIANFLNRTLIIPPIFHHFEVEYGDCGLGRATSYERLNRLAWRAASEKINSSLYTSVTDIIDISWIPPNSVRTIDFRSFVDEKCSVDVTRAARDSSPRRAHRNESARRARYLLNRCGVLLGRVAVSKKKAHRAGQNKRYIVTKGCLDTIYTANRSQQTVKAEYSTKNCKNQVLLDEEKSLLVASLNQRRSLTDLPSMKYADIHDFDNGSTEAGKSAVLVVGSTFYYYDFFGDLGSRQMNELRCNLSVLGFTKPIFQVAKQFIDSQIHAPFACLHHRGSDGAFLPYLNQSWLGKVEELQRLKAQNKGRMALFVMTDLTSPKWMSVYRSTLESMGYDLIFPSWNRSVILGALLDILVNGADEQSRSTFEEMLGLEDRKRLQNVTEDVQMFLESAVCSCSTLGFVYDRNSTLSRFVSQMRFGKVCSSE